MSERVSDAMLRAAMVAMFVIALGTAAMHAPLPAAAQFENDSFTEMERLDENEENMQRLIEEEEAEEAARLEQEKAAARRKQEAAPATRRPFDTRAPVAMVEGIENAPGAGVEFLDYVYLDQTIELGGRGELILSYFESCLRETITGGRVRVGPGQSGVSGGRVATERVECQGQQTIVTADASEAGGAVKRITPFKAEEWREHAVRTDRPVFKWQPKGRNTPVTVSVIYLDADPLRIVWRGATAASYLAYPNNAPRLETGMPYLVQVTYANGANVSAVFSIDPWLDVADSAANRVVPVGR